MAHQLVQLTDDVGVGCEYCGRGVRDPAAEVPWKSVPDKKWCVAKVLAMGALLGVDAEISFGPSGTIKLCPSCRDASMREMAAEVVIDERNGGCKISGM